MQDQIRTFFAGAGKAAADQLPSGAEILITVDESSYLLTMTDKRKVIVEKSTVGCGELEIKGRSDVMNELFSSPANDAFYQKMVSYKLSSDAPEVRILLERTVENAKRFQHFYKHFLQIMYLL